MCMLTWAAPFSNFNSINGDITRVRSSNYTFKRDLQTRVKQLVNSQANRVRVIFRHGTQFSDE